MPENQSWKAYDEFLLTGNLDRYTKLWARYDLFKMILELPGDIVECGVLNGGGVLYWARLLRIFSGISQRKVIGFDTFTGYPTSMKGEEDKKASNSFKNVAQYNNTTPEEIMESAAQLQLEPWIELVKGDATLTIKDYVEKRPGFRVAMLNLDFDIFEPTFSALENLYPRLVPGGVIIFDEYAVSQWGESNAVDRFFKEKNVIYKSLPWAFSPTAYLVKRP